MKRLRLIAILILVIAGLILTSVPASADTSDPDSTPTVEQIDIYRNVIATGDWLIIVHANIPYTTLPITPVTQTFIWRLVDTDNTTILGTTVGFDYNDDGYGFNVYSMYFSAAEVTTLGLTWNTTYTLRLSGNPAVFVTLPVYNYTLNVADYSTVTDTAAVKASVAARILALASTLDNQWGLTSVNTLLAQNETSTVLSIFGEAFFRGAIHGLQAMAPNAFSVVIRVIDAVDRTWSDNYTGNLTDQWSGTWIETAQEAGKALFDTDYDLFSMMILLIMCGGLMVGNIMLTGDHWNGLIDIALLSIIGARLAMYDLGFLILVAALCWLYISAKVWFGIIR